MSFRDDTAARITTALRSAGIGASVNKHCCKGCGHAAMPTALTPGSPYAFVTEQSWEDVRPGSSVWVAFGVVGIQAYEDDEEGLVAAGYRVREALADAGLDAAWEGDITRCIELRL